MTSRLRCQLSLYFSNVMSLNPCKNYLMVLVPGTKCGGTIQTWVVLLSRHIRNNHLKPYPETDLARM